LAASFSAFSAALRSFSRALAASFSAFSAAFFLAAFVFAQRLNAFFTQATSFALDSLASFLNAFSPLLIGGRPVRPPLPVPLGISISKMANASSVEILSAPFFSNWVMVSLIMFCIICVHIVDILPVRF
jgi:hypothetical protein